MAISDVQARIAEIQSFMGAATERSVSPVTRGNGVTAGGGNAAVTGTSAGQFAAILDNTIKAGAANEAENTQSATTQSATTQSAAWTLPTQGVVTSEFGPRWGTQHQGIDIAASTGTAVKAAADGVVRKASWNGGYGNAVVVDHGNGVSTLYAHNSELTVKPGDRVQAGQVVAKVGSTGDSTGPHLHFEVKVNDKRVDPRPWLKERGVTL
jgi:murein DD-endopeptidase MepM/ murein hydrolase activator NlpD